MELGVVVGVVVDVVVVVFGHGEALLIHVVGDPGLELVRRAARHHDGTVAVLARGALAAAPEACTEGLAVAAGVAPGAWCVTSGGPRPRSIRGRFASCFVAPRDAGRRAPRAPRYHRQRGGLAAPSAVPCGDHRGSVEDGVPVQRSGWFTRSAASESWRWATTPAGGSGAGRDWDSMPVVRERSCAAAGAGAQKVSALQYGLSEEKCPPVKPRMNE